jgi:hypothetical protein
VNTASLDATYLVHPDEAPALLRGLDKHIPSVIGREVKYKISQICNAEGQMVIAIGSANADLYLGRDEERLLSSLGAKSELRGVARCLSRPLADEAYMTKYIAAIHKIPTLSKNAEEILAGPGRNPPTPKPEDVNGGTR